MREDTVVQLRQPGTFSEDPLTEILRLGARRLLVQAIEWFCPRAPLVMRWTAPTRRVRSVPNFCGVPRTANVGS